VSIRETQRFFDERASEWDASLAPETLERAAAIIAGLPIEAGSRVLDVGCGTGVLFPMLWPKVGRGGWVVAVDVSVEMLRLAKQKGADGQTSCLLADVTDTPFVSSCFDWVLCYSVFPHFEDQGRVLKELARTLKDGGRLVVCHSKSRDEINGIHQTAGGPVANHRLPDEPVMRPLVQSAGLAVTQLDSLPNRYILVAEKSAAS